MPECLTPRILALLHSVEWQSQKSCQPDPVSHLACPQEQAPSHLSFPLGALLGPSYFLTPSCNSGDHELERGPMDSPREPHDPTWAFGLGIKHPNADDPTQYGQLTPETPSHLAFTAVLDTHISLLCPAQGRGAKWSRVPGMLVIPGLPLWLHVVAPPPSLHTYPAETAISMVTTAQKHVPPPPSLTDQPDQLPLSTSGHMPAKARGR